MEVRSWKLPGLVTLGLRFNNWIAYWAATIALIVLCVYMGRAWLAVKPRLRALAGLATA